VWRLWAGGPAHRGRAGGVVPAGRRVRPRARNRRWDGVARAGAAQRRPLPLRLQLEPGRGVAGVRDHPPRRGRGRAVPARAHRPRGRRAAVRPAQPHPAQRFDGLARRVARFLVAQQQADGSILQYWGPATGSLPGVFGKFSTGEAFYALALMRGVFPAEGYAVRQPDHWAAYGLAELAPAGLTEVEADYGRWLAGYFGFGIRFESQHEGRVLNPDRESGAGRRAAAPRTRRASCPRCARTQTPPRPSPAPPRRRAGRRRRRP
jgi:hypothetical protein